MLPCSWRTWPRIRALVLFGALLVAVCGCATATTPQAPVAAGPRTVIVQLFEWKWTDIAQECENFLGPRGYKGVQISPPQEAIVSAGNPWWVSYQPVSYKLDSRNGSQAEFTDMVKRCNAAGVAIYADAVINHMTGADSGTGNAGTTFTHYAYPGLYQYEDFHHCGMNGNDDIVSYQNRTEVQTCELLNLADLNTGSVHVQDTLAGYLNNLLSMGVAGFRIDAAKHIAAQELHTIQGKINKTLSGAQPYIYQEVIEGASEPIKAGEYTMNGNVTEFKYGDLLSTVISSGSLADLSSFGSASVFLPSNSAMVFIDNHDTQRSRAGAGGVLTFKDGPLYHLAVTYMLAWPYGQPIVMSSYQFDNADQGPPANADGSIRPVYTTGAPDCGQGRWVCEQRWPDVAGMAGFRNYTAAAPEVSNWWSDNNNAIAFGRGDKGFVIINRENQDVQNTFQTSLPAGTYCDVTKGTLAADGKSCTGPTVTVSNAGQISATVPAMSAVAIHGGAKVAGP
jgi:alpha-amylase